MMDFMEEALKEAEKAFELGEVPVGAVLVDMKTITIISKACNMVETHKNQIMHAEMLVLESGFKIKNSKILDDCAIYVTLEPCAMCAAAIAYSRIAKLYYGAEDQKFGAVQNNIRYFNSACCFHRPEVYYGIKAQKSSFLLQSFFALLRK